MVPYWIPRIALIPIKNSYIRLIFNQSNGFGWEYSNFFKPDLK